VAVLCHFIYCALCVHSSGCTLRFNLLLCLLTFLRLYSAIQFTALSTWILVAVFRHLIYCAAFSACILVAVLLNFALSYLMQPSLITTAFLSSSALFSPVSSHPLAAVYSLLSSNFLIKVRPNLLSIFCTMQSEPCFLESVAARLLPVLSFADLIRSHPLRAISVCG
jgi:hypothetical protein